MVSFTFDKKSMIRNSNQSYTSIRDTEWRFSNNGHLDILQVGSGVPRTEENIVIHWYTGVFLSWIKFCLFTFDTLRGTM
jgi:hypothetical protein